MVGVKAAAVSHVGKIRANNQDSGYCGRHLFVVADGMGGHAGGDVASAVAVNRILQLDQEFGNVEEARNALEAALVAANTLLTETVAEHPELAGMGTTVSAALRVENRFVIAHIGDSRVYRVRDGDVEQLTSDHTFVQRLVDSGRITAEEALTHPRRSVLMRVLGDIDGTPEIDTLIVDARPGDRFLLCSDGLSSYVPEAKFNALLSDDLTPRQISERMLKLALDGGAPDNVTVVVVEVTDDASLPPAPVLVGSAVAPLTFQPTTERKSFRITTSILHPISTITAAEDSHFEPDSDEYLDALIAEDIRRARFRRIRWLVGFILVILFIVLGAVLAYRWTQTRFYIGEEAGFVAIYRGVPQDVGPIQLSSLHTVYDDLPLDELSPYFRSRIEGTIAVDSLQSAIETVERISHDAR